MVKYTKEVTDENFEEFTSDSMSLVDIWAPWCGPCMIIGPIVDELSSDYKDRLLVGKLNADDNRETITKLKIRNIPTLLLYKNGEMIEKVVGAVTKASLTEIIEKHLQD